MKEVATIKSLTDKEKRFAEGTLGIKQKKYGINGEILNRKK